jgi:hypothetical protein
MADVIRGKTPGLSGGALAGYAFHGVTAILTLWLLFKALGL